MAQPTMVTTLPATAADRALVALERMPVEDTETRQRVDRLRDSIDLNAPASVLNFGNEVEQDLARFADTVLDQVMAKDTGPLHGKLTEIRLIAQDLSVDKIAGKKGFFSRLFSSVKAEIIKLTDQFKTARQQIDTIAMQLEDQAQEISFGLTVLDKLFDQNLIRFRDLGLHVQAGHEALAHARDVLLPGMEGELAKSADAEKMLLGQRLRDLKAGIDRLDRKILNLEKSRTIALAMLPTIRQSQQTGVNLVEELRMAIAHAIPAWKAAMIVHIEQLRQRHGLETLAAMRDFTNEQLKSMASQLEQNVEMSYRESERGIADTEAIVETMGSLIRTIDKVENLEKAAAAARQSSRVALRRAETEFRAALGGERQAS